MVPKFLQATLRQYDFMIKGLEEVEGELRSKNIPFHLLMGDPVENVPQFAQSQSAMLVVCDFSPLRVGLAWTKSVGEGLDGLEAPIPLVQVQQGLYIFISYMNTKIHIHILNCVPYE